MIYLIGGLFASAAMLLYRRPPSRVSPLWNLSLGSSTLTARLHADGGRILSAVGVTVSFTILFLIAALRYGVGTDYWARYAPLFDQIRAGDTIAPQEPGFFLLNRAVALFTNDYQGIFAVTSFLTILLYYRFFLRMSVSPALSVFIFGFGGFYLEDFNLIKQGLAIAIVVNAIELALRKRWLAFVILTLLAASIHASALVWFLVLPLMWVRTGKAARIAIAAAMFLAVLVLPRVLIFVVEQLAPSYAWYFQSNYGVTRGIHPVVVAVAVIAFVFTIVVVGRSASGDRYADAIVNVFAVSTAVLLATITIAYFFSRVNYYFAPVQLVAIPLALSLVRRPFARRLLTLAFMALYLSSFVFQFLIGNAHGVMPYESILSR